VLVAELPFRKVLAAHHFIGDLTLPFGRKIHDDMKV
jgi:acetoacetate decarboxylase